MRAGAPPSGHLRRLATSRRCRAVPINSHVQPHPTTLPPAVFNISTPQAIFCAVAEGIPADNPHLVLLFFISQLLLRELAKCRRLVQVVPMDMSGLYENRPGPSNLGNVISQILLCKTITPDFNQEELCSIAKDSQDVLRLLQDMQEYLPRQEAGTERNSALQEAEGSRSGVSKMKIKPTGLRFEELTTCSVR
ncbi:uncharacterized protein LOC126088336 [Schistocerca cancellata]|uniref:uncharacterized protein LOC126088336 n=1 Tax=Schistocerca cancellata TaxID=274614 RepID=UPI0021199321|nr:uncharacterized protein LOC126088336 [Schistocerca cancellata]